MKKTISLLLALVLMFCTMLPLAVTAAAEEACEHNYVLSETVERTCSGRGYQVYTCTKCAAYEMRNIQEPIGHIDENDDGRCDNCDEELPMYFLKHFIYLLLEFIKTVLKIK